MYEHAFWLLLMTRRYQRFRRERDRGGSQRHRQRIVAPIRRLSTTPRPPGCEKLSGQERYRVRQGVSRIVYSINDRESSLLIVKVGHRKEIYR
jgi:mRNA interferase RelE/StbE